MRIVIQQNMTLDGRVEMLDDWFDPGGQDDDLAAELRDQSAREDVLLLGRQTFCDLRGYWPHLRHDPTGVAQHLNRVDKRVVSATLTEPGWENSSVVEGDALAAVRSLREQPGQDVVVTAASSCAMRSFRPVWSMSIACSSTPPGRAGGVACFRRGMQYRPCGCCGPRRSPTE